MNDAFLIDFEPICHSPQTLAGSAEVLRPEEKVIYHKFKFTKRRNEWLAGRIAAKRVARRRFEELGLKLTEDKIVIRSNGDGVPSAQAEGKDCRISITHCGAVAAAAAPAKAQRLGIDIELVEPRDPAWARLSFHEDERVDGLSDVELTTLWTLKEAVLKLLETGLSVDLWDVRFIPDKQAPALGALGPRRLELHNRAKRAWTVLGEPDIRFHTEAALSNIILSAAYTYGRTND